MPARSDTPAARPEPEATPGPTPAGANPGPAPGDTAHAGAASTADAAQLARLAALGRLTGGMVHDFNNLLAVIQSGVSLIERAGGSDPALAPVLGALRDAVRRGQGLTQRLLALALTQDAAPRRERIDVGARLRDQAAWLGRLLGSRIRLDAALPEDLRPVEVDPDRLELAVLDLCLELRDAQPDGGTITLRARPADDAVQIAIGGSAAPAATRARTLALTRVQSFVSAHGGTLSIDGEVGGGGGAGAGPTVTLTLPAARDTA